MSDERKVAERYRELPREEPPRALDEAILAASRRAVDARPAPLVAPSGRKRWTFPLAAAAVIVLAVAVTVQVERERPDAEVMSGPVATQEAKRKDQPPPARDAPKPIAKKAPASEAFTPDPKPKLDAAPERRNQMQERPAERDLAAAAPPAPAAAPAPPQESVGGLRGSAGADATAKAERRADAQSAPTQSAPARSSRVAPEVAKGGIDREVLREFMKQSVSPEQMLQGIVDLRRQGRHDEADKALADFRKRFPNYRLSDEVRAKVEKN